jgi:hypothetical protein
LGRREPGFLWQRGRFIVLPPPPVHDGYQYLFPYGINDRTQVVGGSSDGAFVWEHGRRAILPGLTRDAVALDINERGVIAGRNPTRPDGTLPHAVIWVR